MNQLSRPRRINVAAVLTAAVGIMIILVSAPDLFPPIPPGPIILAVTAGLVGFVRARWTAVIWSSCRCSSSSAASCPAVWPTT